MLYNVRIHIEFLCVAIEFRSVLLGDGIIFGGKQSMSCHLRHWQLMGSWKWKRNNSGDGFLLLNSTWNRSLKDGVHFLNMPLDYCEHDMPIDICCSESGLISSSGPAKPPESSYSVATAILRYSINYTCDEVTPILNTLDHVCLQHKYWFITGCPPPANTQNNNATERWLCDTKTPFHLPYLCALGVLCYTTRG